MINIGANFPWNRFFSHPRLASIEDLQIQNPHYFIDPSLRELAASPHLGSLTDLTLNGIHTGIEGIRALMGSERFPSLRRLDLRYNRRPTRHVTIRRMLAEWSARTGIQVDY